MNLESLMLITILEWCLDLILCELAASVGPSQQDEWKAKAPILDISNGKYFFMQNSISIETCDNITKGDKTLSYKI